MLYDMERENMKKSNIESERINKERLLQISKDLENLLKNNNIEVKITLCSERIYLSTKQENEEKINIIFDKPILYRITRGCADSMPIYRIKDNAFVVYERYYTSNIFKKNIKLNMELLLYNKELIWDIERKIAY